MDFSRSERVSEEIKRIVSQTINHELKDPRIKGFITVTRVEVPKDLRHARIYISIYGDETEKQQVLEGLINASGFIRKDLASKIRLKLVPEISFSIDKSVEYSLQINKLLQEIHSGGDNTDKDANGEGQ